MLQILILIFLSSASFAKLSHESEVSTVAAGGNSNVSTYLVRTANQYDFGIRLLKFGGHYTYGEAQNVVSARDWDGSLKYEQLLSPKLAIAGGELVEGYRFQGIKARYNSDIGLKYYYIKSEERNFFSELGYRYTIEDRYAGDNQYENKGRFLNEINQKVSETFQYRFWFEYVPNFTNKSDYLVTYEASLISILTSMFSLKVAYKGIYDQEPAVEGNRNYDYTYTTSLVAKF